MSWSLKKWLFGFGGWKKHNIDFKILSKSINFLEKYDELSESVAFGQKLRCFTAQNEAKGEPHENDFEQIHKFRNECYKQSKKYR